MRSGEEQAPLFGTIVGASSLMSGKLLLFSRSTKAFPFAESWSFIVWESQALLFGIL